jgi:hypothetical protein
VSTIQSVTYDPKTQVLTLSVKCQSPAPSASGKTLVVATTHGNQPTEVQISGKTLVLGMNAYIRAA